MPQHKTGANSRFWSLVVRELSRGCTIGSCSPTGIFLGSRKILYLVSRALSQLFQGPWLNRSLSNAGCCKTCCTNWSSVCLGSVFLTLETKQAGSDAGAPGISKHILCCRSFLVLRYIGKSQNMFTLNHDHQPEWNDINIWEQTGSVMSGEVDRFPVDVCEHYFRQKYCIECF